MDCHDKIDALITTITIDLEGCDNEKLKMENQKILNMIQNIEFEGELYPLFDSKLSTIDF